MASVFAPKECSTRDAFMPRPPAESLRDENIRAIFENQPSTSILRSTEGLIVTVSINTQCYPEFCGAIPTFKPTWRWPRCASSGAPLISEFASRSSPWRRPVLMAVRYSVSGLILLAVAYFSKAHLPSGRELWYTALYGVIIIGGGTGCLVFAEQWVPSGLAVGLHHRIAFLDDRSRSADSRRRAIAWSHHLSRCSWGWRAPCCWSLPRSCSEGFGGPLLRGFLLLQVGCGGLVPRVHPAAPSSDQGPSRCQRSGAATGHRNRLCHPGRIIRQAASVDLDRRAASELWLISWCSVPSSAIARTSSCSTVCRFRWSASITTSTR